MRYRKAAKLTLDIVMTALIIVAMVYHVTGNLVHEVVGMVLMLLFIMHNVLNRYWYRHFLQGWNSPPLVDTKLS